METLCEKYIALTEMVSGDLMTLNRHIEACVSEGNRPHERGATTPRQGGKQIFKRVLMNCNHNNHYCIEITKYAML